MAQRQTDVMLDQLAAAGQPNMIQLANRVPLLVIMELIGAPYEDADSSSAGGTRSTITRAAARSSPSWFARAHTSLGEFRAYVSDLIDRRAAQDTSLLAGLREAHQEDRLTREELEATMVLILFAGHETTST